MTVIESLFTTCRNQHGDYQLTLARYTSKFITDIEFLFGPRDTSFTFVGIEMDATPQAIPRNWFPYSGAPVGESVMQTRHVLIRLTGEAPINPEYACWQLAHECVHLLDPWHIDAEGQPLNFLEEGIAAWYQDMRCPKYHNIDAPYVEAKSLVEPYMPALGNAVKHIRTQHKTRISAIDDPDLLLRHCPEMENLVAENLCRRFPST